MSGRLALQIPKLPKGFAFQSVSLKQMFMSEEFQRGVRVYQEMHQRMTESLAKAAENAVKFKKHLPEQLQTLAEHGWFVLGEHTPLSAIYPLAVMFSSLLKNSQKV